MFECSNEQSMCLLNNWKAWFCMYVHLCVSMCDVCDAHKIGAWARCNSITCICNYSISIPLWFSLQICVFSVFIASVCLLLFLVKSAIAGNEWDIPLNFEPKQVDSRCEPSEQISNLVCDKHKLLNLKLKAEYKHQFGGPVFVWIVLLDRTSLI